MKKKVLAMVLSLVLLVVGVASGTMAWLTAQTDSVTNTFTNSDISVELTETPAEYKMIPGYTIAKDPKVKVEAGSEECYLFVKLEKSDNFDTFMTYEMAEGWTELKDADGTVVTGVYFRKITTADMGTEYSVLKNDQVTVKGEVTKEQMNALTKNTLPKLIITAYASQLHKNNTDNFDADEAWANIQ